MLFPGYLAKIKILHFVSSQAQKSINTFPPPLNVDVIVFLFFFDGHSSLWLKSIRNL